MPVDRLPASSDASFTTTLRDSPSAVKLTRWLWLICPVPTAAISRSSTGPQPSTSPSHSGVISSRVRTNVTRRILRGPRPEARGLTRARSSSLID